MAERTLRGYREELVLLIQGDVPFVAADLARFIGHGNRGRPLALATRNRRLVIVRSFCRYLVGTGELASDPTAGIKRVPLPRGQQVALAPGDLSRALQSLRTQGTGWQRTRDESLFLIFFNTGLRVRELQAIDLDQVDLAHGLLRSVLRKGGDHQDVVLNEAAAGALGTWLRVRPSTDTSALFLSRSHHRLSVRMIQKRLQIAGKAAGLPVGLHPHALRHAHATELLEAGASSGVD